jgi:putative ABC transport system substrate-binding protein
MIGRLGFLCFALLASSAVATARSSSTPRVGLLCSVLCTPRAIEAFQRVLRTHGYVDGQTVEVLHRREDQDADRIDAFARELIDKKVDVITAMDLVPAWAARYHTRTIPIVAGLRDPTVLGRLERPAPNITGLSLIWSELAGKRLELLKEAVPTVSRIGVIWRGGWWAGGMVGAYSGLHHGAQALGFTVHRIDVETLGELDAAFSTFVRERVDGFLIGPHESFVVHRAHIAQLALKHGLPGISEHREYADAGGLMAYGPRPVELFNRAAYQVVKILRGAKPSQVPIEQPATLELVINLKTAKTLGLTIPQAVLLRADEVIQ